MDAEDRKKDYLQFLEYARVLVLYVEYAENGQQDSLTAQQHHNVLAILRPKLERAGYLPHMHVLDALLACAKGHCEDTAKAYSKGWQECAVEADKDKLVVKSCKTASFIEFTIVVAATVGMFILFCLATFK